MGLNESAEKNAGTFQWECLDCSLSAEYTWKDLAEKQAEKHENWKNHSVDRGWKGVEGQ